PQPAPPTPARPEPVARAPRSDAAKRPGKVAKDVRELRRRLQDVERQIHQLEARLAEIGERLGDPAFYADGARVRAVAAERKSAEEQVTWLMREWEQLSTALAAHE
ncbi:MAG: ABC transporter C-terminal domain-containing protein, partial [Candidatus Rokuibacteriota bacterium]